MPHIILSLIKYDVDSDQMYFLSGLLILHLYTSEPCEWLMLFPHRRYATFIRGWTNNVPRSQEHPFLEGLLAFSRHKVNNTVSLFLFLMFWYAVLHSLIASFFPLQIRIGEKMSQEINLGDRPHCIFRIPFPFRKVWF